MTQNLLTLPLRLGIGAARTALDVSGKTIDLSARLAGTALEILRPGSATDPPSDQPDRGEGRDAERREAATLARPRPAPAATPSSQEFRTNGHAASTEHATPTPPAEQPETPVSPSQAAVKTIEDEDEVVAEFSEPGAEDGAGAQLEVEAPWKGYAELKAADVIDRIGQATAAELALVELYEQTHRRRQTVIDAAAKRLRALAPPEPE